MFLAHTLKKIHFIKKLEFASNVLILNIVKRFVSLKIKQILIKLNILLYPNFFFLNNFNFLDIINNKKNCADLRLNFVKLQCLLLIKKHADHDRHIILRSDRVFSYIYIFQVHLRSYSHTFVLMQQFFL